MTVRLEELLAAFAREPTADSPLEDVLAWTGARQQVEKLAPEMARLLIDMGEAGTCRRFTVSWCRDRQDIAEDEWCAWCKCAARLDTLGNQAEENA